MSQHITDDISPQGVSPPEQHKGNEEKNQLLVERYLQLLETNRQACRATITDAGLALDMAGFVRRQLCWPSQQTRIPTALLARALVQRLPEAPDQ